MGIDRSVCQDFSAAKSPDRNEVNEAATPHQHDSESCHRSQHEAHDQFVLCHGNALSMWTLPLGVSEVAYRRQSRASYVQILQSTANLENDVVQQHKSSSSQVRQHNRPHRLPE